MRKSAKIAKLHSTIWYIAIGVLIGLIAGVIVSAFRMMITIILEWVIESYHFLAENTQWLPVWILLSLGMMYILGLLIKSDPHIKGSGIPQVELQIQGKIEMNWWSVLWKKFIGGGISIGSGLLLGREGPSIQLGASIGQGVASILKTSRAQRNVFISSGAGAGLAAAFHAPIAGLMFVLEEVHHTFSPIVALTTLTSAIVANFVALQIFGLHPALNLGNDILFPVKYYGYVALLGILLGILGYAYQYCTVRLGEWYHKVFPKVPLHFYGMIAALFIIPVGLNSPQLLGGGGELILELLEKNPAWVTLAFLFILRFIYSMISYGTGLPGGIFLPILSLGAIIGLIFGNIIVGYLGVEEIYLVSFVYFAMAGYFASIGKAPLTALILVTEMVGGLNQLMPLGICTLVAYITAELLHVEPIYEQLSERMMLHLEEAPSSIQKDGYQMTFEVPIFVESPLVGKEIKAISWPKEMLIIAVRRGAKEETVHGSFVLQPGDILVVSSDVAYTSHIHGQLQKLTSSGKL